MKKRIEPTKAEQRYFNREASWLAFNNRVLYEASNTMNPLLERLKFLAIFESNLDEFYMVRVSGLIEQFEAQVMELTPDGMTPSEQLTMIAELAHPLRKKADQILAERLLPELSKAGIQLSRIEDLSTPQRQAIEQEFRKDIFPVCTPLALEPANSFPFISNRSLNLAVDLEDPSGGRRLARVKVPTVIPRLIRVTKRRHVYLLLEDVIAANLNLLFPGMKVKGCYRFRVVRDADVEIQELEAADLFSNIEQTLRMRKFGAPVLLECEERMPKRIRDFLMKFLELEKDDLFEVGGILGLDVCYELAGIKKSGLTYPPHTPFQTEDFQSPDSIFDAIAAKDVLVHHPFDSFRCVEEFIAAAASDPKVVGIKQTLYRVGSESPIVESLLDAAEAGKQVAAMVELKARFDESNNLVWSRALERAGVHVTYGFREMKTHCKLCLVVRREGNVLKSYAHVSTGNYNPSTSRLYTDFGLFTCDEEVTQDISELFNFLTGFSKQEVYRKLLVAPLNLRDQIIERIQREIKFQKKNKAGRIVFKLNSLVDPEVIDALYEASAAGVQIDLIVRGICCLRPKVPGLSDNISVVSIIGRFLEHSRIYYFSNGGQPEVLIGSADMMRRNLDRRIETLVPVSDSPLIHYLKESVIDLYLKDNVRSWRLQPSGNYERAKPKPNDKLIEAQSVLINRPALKCRFD